VDITIKPKLEEIDKKIQELQIQIFSASKLFAEWWEKMKNKNDLEDRRSDLDRIFLATAGITALAPHMASRLLNPDLKSLGFPLDDVLKNREHQKVLEKELENCQADRKKLTSDIQKLNTLKHIEAAVGGLGLDDIFEDTIVRLYTVQGIWHALRKDTGALLFEVEKSGSAEACKNMILRFECLYDALWFALDTYTSEVAKTDKSQVKTSPTTFDGTNSGGSKGGREDKQPRVFFIFRSPLGSLFKIFF
jgi:hypothetical protein